MFRREHFSPLGDLRLDDKPSLPVYKTTVVVNRKQAAWLRRLRIHAGCCSQKYQTAKQQFFHRVNNASEVTQSVNKPSMHGVFDYHITNHRYAAHSAEYHQRAID